MNLVKKEIIPTPFVAYPEQKPIIEVSVQTILAKENGLVVQPTSTGKSTESAFVARACILIHGFRGMYLYNENEGLDQARASFEFIFNGNPIKCANFFGGEKEDPDHADIIFASFQSMNNHHEKWYEYFEKDRFDFILVNEAHHGQATTYKEVLDYFNASKIGFTATPEREDGLDILDIFHKVIANISFEEAYVRGMMSKMKYIVKSFDINKKKLKAIFNDVIEEGKTISIKQLNETLFIDKLDSDVLKDIYLYTCEERKQTLIYCENILHATRIYEQLVLDGKDAGIIHSKKSRGKNKRTLKRFRIDEIQFLVSVDKLNEDIDLPNVEVGVFLRCTNSRRIFFQQLGRPGRKKPGKVALILDYVANAERLIMLNEFKDDIEAKRKELFYSTDLPELDKTILVSQDTDFTINFKNEELEIIKITNSILEHLGLRGVWPAESELRDNVFLHFENNTFTGKEFNEVRDKFDGPNATNFQRIYSKTFNEVFGREKFEINRDWPAESELRDNVFLHFENNTFTQREYDVVRNIVDGPISGAMQVIYSKSFNEVFGREKRNIMSEWPTESDLRIKAIAHFENNTFIIKEYDKVRGKIGGPSSGAFNSIYAKSFNEVFGREKFEINRDWSNEKDLKTKAVAYFKNNTFTSKEYDKVRDKFGGPGSGVFQKHFSKSFNEVFGRKKVELNRDWPNEKDLKTKAITHFKNNSFTSKEYDKVRDKLGGPSSGAFHPIYAKSFNEVFGRKKLELNRDWPNEKDLKTKAITHFKNNSFTSKEYDKVRDKLGGPNQGEFKRIYAKSFNEVFGREKGSWAKKS